MLFVDTKPIVDPVNYRLSRSIRVNRLVMKAGCGHATLSGTDELLRTFRTSPFGVGVAECHSATSRTARRGLRGHARTMRTLSVISELRGIIRRD